MNDKKSNLLRIVTLDDHEIFLRGIGDVLRQEPDFMLLGGYTSSRELFLGLEAMEVDVLVMDYSLAPGDMDGLELIKTLKIRYPSLAVLVISAFYNSATVALALHCGAKGFIGKNLPSGNLVHAIRGTGTGRIYIEPEIALQLAQLHNIPSVVDGSQGYETGHADKVLNLSLLSPKEQEVIRCFMEGMTVSDIAEKFMRSIKTISGQKQTALRKLGLKADRELFLYRNALK